MTTLNDVRDRIASARSAHLATASADADPHLMPVVFALVGDRLYIAIDEKPKRTLRLRRLTNIEANPRAAVLVDAYHDDDWTRLWWVLLRGPADVLWPQAWDADEADAAIAALRDKYPQYANMALELRPLLRLTVERVTAWGGANAQPD